MDHSGTIEINGDTLVWTSDGSTLLTADLCEVVVVGEYTNTAGPWFDDWFLELVMRDGSSQSVSMYAKNIEVLIEYLSKKFKTSIEAYQLAGSAFWQSVVLYPESLKGNPVFKFDAAQHVVLADEVKEFIQNYTA